MSTTSIIDLTDQIRKEALNESNGPQGGQSHARVLQLVDELKLAVETPTETILRLIYQPPENAALRTVADLDVFPILMSSESKKGTSATEIAKLTGADRGLIIRLMRVMASLGLCTSSEPEVYRATEKTASMTQPIGKDGVPCIYDLTLPTLSKLPEYLRRHNYINPQEYATSPMKWAVGQSQFEWLAGNKKHQDLFNSYMSSRREGKPNWFSVYPIQRLVEGASDHPDAIFLVDIGGNQGHDLARLHAEYPAYPGRLMLQDLPNIISSVDRPGIEKSAYSFLDPQPIKNARAYYFRAIFHDWPDRICHKILLNTVSAMNPLYSRIIIVDFVLPDTDVPRMQSAMDIQMMSIGAGVERSKQQWVNLLASVGLQINGIWNTGLGMESIIEAVPVADLS
ncbi:hypothetical protein N7532_007114 [Penicillium argentinense]|uniref:O-methyltransferase domain-containing protein n=1 Tax=Penicillium argentinense TaxID=1131581 RepID=A0A9W9FHA0_9EURO|nr:uncharacterized protein N7532_007114 [Penicillium argentinense]KAJ5100113.1 hypothetical protein N7532_007114 [Penicillium argentinense]